MGGLTSYCGKIAREAAQAELHAQEKDSENSPARRFRSSFSGVLTQAQRKEYPPSPPVLTQLQIREPNKSEEKNEEKEGDGKESEEVINLSNQPDKANKPEIPGPVIQENLNPLQPKSDPVVVRCSVIQRVPSASSSLNSSAPSSNSSSPAPAPAPVESSQKPVVLPPTQPQQIYQRLPFVRPALFEPEQEHPIDYHVPKKPSREPLNNQSQTNQQHHVGDEEEEDQRIKKFEKVDEREKRVQEAKRALLTRTLMSRIRNYPPGQAASIMSKISGIIQTAAGHGRSNNNSGSQGNGSNGSGTQNGSSGGGSISFSAGGGAGGGGGCAGGGSAGGGNGRDGRSNYGPNSPPTGSLPPFYESLKSGNQNGGMNAYNAQGNGFGNYLIGNSMNQMDCDGNVTDMTNLGYPNSPPDPNGNKQYSVLQNAYLQNGIILKDEIDLDYDAKIDSLSLNGNLLQSSYDYNDSMMVDLSNADPLQLTATLTFSSPSDHALLENLTDAVDLSQFFPRLPSDDDQSPCNDLDLSSTPSITPDTVSGMDQHHQNLPFQDQLIIGRNSYQDTDSKSFFKSSPSSTSSYENPPPNYRDHNNLHHSLLQQQHQQHNIGLNGFDLDSHSNLSLPSPTNGHYDQLNSPTNSAIANSENLQPPTCGTPSPMAIASTIQNVSKLQQKNRRDSAAKATVAKLSSILASTDTSPLVGDLKLPVLQQRVSNQILKISLPNFLIN